MTRDDVGQGVIERCLGVVSVRRVLSYSSEEVKKM